MFKKALLACLTVFIIASCSTLKIRDYRKISEPKEIYEEGLKLMRATEYDLAIEYFNFFLKKYSKAEYEKYVSLSTYCVAFCYYMKGDEKKAVIFLNKVLANSKSRTPRILAGNLRTKILSGDGYKNSSYKSNNNKGATRKSPKNDNLRKRRRR